MKTFLILSFVMLTLTVSVFANITLNQSGNIAAPGRPGSPPATLDGQCTIDFQHFLYGSYSGTMTWPGNAGTFYLGAFCFSNSCTPGVEFCAYCVDLDHRLNQDAYCVSIDEAVVSSTYPEQYRSMAYLMSWYPVTSDLEDRIMQLALWKLTTNDMCHTDGYGQPYYYLNDGRGYPNLGDTPVFPYVNTVYNSDPGNNDPANVRVLDALGVTDGIPKNVIMSGDQILIAADPVVISAGIATLPLTITVQRGGHAVGLGNASCSGIKLQCSVSSGTLSAAEVFTNNVCQAHVTVSQPVTAATTAHFTVCSQGLWPELITDCNRTDCVHSQVLVSQTQGTGSMVQICESVDLNTDIFLAVELASFGAVASDNNVTLNWSTSSESNNGSFELVRNGSVVGSVPAAGMAHNYTWTDNRVQNGTTYSYTLVGVDVNGHRETLRTVEATPMSSAPNVAEYALQQNYPNPFNPTTQIVFDMKEAGFASLKVYNMMGQQVDVLVNGETSQGRHSVTFDAKNLPSGLYICKMETNGFVAQQKMLLMK